MELSIITCTIHERSDMLSRLRKQIASQADGLPVEHIIVPGDGTVGRKINAGFRKSTGRYICVVDDDDTVSSGYIRSILDACTKQPDVVTFGMQTPYGVVWLRTKVDDGICIKTANHLCAWRRELALAAPLVPRTYAWDVVWYRALKVGFPNATEQHIPKVMYHYLFSPQTTRAQSPENIADSMDNNGSRLKIVRLQDGRLAAGPSPDRMWAPDMQKLDPGRSDADDYELLDEVVLL